MCGICGVVDTRRQSSADDLRSVAERMAGSMTHRGPDGAGTFVDASSGVAFGHRRLRVIDVSPLGDQPMTSRDGRLVMTYNGEIYNHRALRQDLEASGVRFRGHSDTEVLLEAMATWGIIQAIERANGMFALAVWDAAQRVLTLARDRMGEKPLYYGRLGSAFVFSSELKAIKLHPDFVGEIDREALALYLRSNCVPAPHTIFRGVSKLSPGHVLRFAPGNGQVHEPRPYWSLESVARAGLAQRATGSGWAEEALHDLLTDAVGLRMLADVPVGAFLSGGIDSSLVVALMQAQSSKPVRTFTIGFLDDDYDEARYARAVARHLGTSHTELYVTPLEAQAVVPRLPAIYDEPFSDSSQIPTFLVADLARRDVTVSLSGDGGDELFAGYDRYMLFQRLWKLISAAPMGVRRVIGRSLESVSQPAWDAAISRLSPVLPGSLRQARPGARMHRLARVIRIASPPEAYRALMAQWQDPEAILARPGEPRALPPDKWPRLNGAGLVDYLQHLDQMTYLPDDILTKVDRASMAVSLEARVPLLDHRVVELAWALGDKIRGGRGKQPLRAVLRRYVPDSLVERPKMGFGIPIGAWLRGPLRGWTQSLLAEDLLREDGYFVPQPICRVWAEHLRRDDDWVGGYQLWNILMFQAWLHG